MVGGSKSREALFNSELSAVAVAVAAAPPPACAAASGIGSTGLWSTARTVWSEAASSKALVCEGWTPADDSRTNGSWSVCGRRRDELEDDPSQLSERRSCDEGRCGCSELAPVLSRLPT